MKVIESTKFRQWLKKLKDDTGRARVVSRINRLAAGLAGDVAPVGQGVSELRIHYGPGYRVYYYQQGEVLVLLLCGGDKGSQRRDIETAHQILKEWREQHHG
ncbi:type II toxin-antitoxin system RelE/ParE family toxin [Zobellella iuensis]|uniref:Type II toxin-antitoxin system RelE/ParE family toxin n=1 Tax=Zobellella iuensis TaxID=2803811 RepID=A0ABS1QXB8_9GAMM|nr:type II toxin-antitoxin system RelE/ParE family toxin [Zobellella iuensis]MBL1379187.1 type II toxin-antitoxin system RelE/ParE family toxin [Zobellella iuensis]